MHHKIEFDCKCEACKGTGIYVGFAERDGFGVVCGACKGTGKLHKIIEYDDFTNRGKRKGVKKIIRANPGITVGINPVLGLTLESFGGMDYLDWLKGKPFPKKSEMRNFICPAWWCQNVDYKKKPEWDCCPGFGAFSDCPQFANKRTCWERFDRISVNNKQKIPKGRKMLI